MREITEKSSVKKARVNWSIGLHPELLRLMGVTTTFGDKASLRLARTPVPIQIELVQGL